MKIQKVIIQNFKNLSSKTSELNGKSAYIFGGNAKGKTSFIDAAFCEMPGQPLKEGARNGKVTVELDKYTCEFKFSSKTQKAKLNIYNKEGEAQKKPAALLKEIFGITDFNIDEFLNMSETKQVDFIKDIVGIDWSDLDEEYKEIYSERTFLTRQAKELDGLIGDDYYNPDLKAIDTAPIQERINAIAKLDGFRERLKDREKALQEYKIKVSELEKEVKKGTDFLKSKQTEKTEDVQKELEAATETNKKAAANEKNKDRGDQSGELWTKIDAIEDRIKIIKDTKKNELENNPLPVAGLSFDEDGLFLDGIPFKSDQINTARRIIVGLELQYQLMGEVKIARFDASLLDKSACYTLIEWADQRGVQLFMELVDRDGGELKIEINEE